MEHTKPTKHRADRDLWNQLRAIKNAMKMHEEELIHALPQGNWHDEGSTSKRRAKIELYEPSEMRSRIEGAEQANRTLLMAELSKAESIGPQRQLAEPPGVLSLQQMRSAFPHFEPVLRLVAQRRALAMITPGHPYHLPPILLAGKPGVGKTAFAEALAACLNQPMRRLDIATSTAGFALAGSHESWDSARHGAVWSLLQNSSASGVLLLDEIDKTAESRYPVLGSLYALLEPISSRHFVDEYIQVPVDASHLTVVATCNDVNLIDRALLSRFQVFDIPAPTPEQIPAIASSVYAQLHTTEPWGRVFPSMLSPQVLRVLGSFTPRELRALFQEAVAHAAEQGRRHIIAEDILVQSEAVAARRQTVRSHQSIGFL